MRLEALGGALDAPAGRLEVLGDASRRSEAPRAHRRTSYDTPSRTSTRSRTRLSTRVVFVLPVLVCVLALTLGPEFGIAPGLGRTRTSTRTRPNY